MPTPGPLFRLIVYGGKGISRVDGHFRWSNMGVTSGLVHCNKVLFFCQLVTEAKIWIQGPGLTLPYKEISSVSSWITHHLTCSCTCTRLLVTSRPDLFRAL
jgi:hypothetical protein